MILTLKSNGRIKNCKVTRKKDLYKNTDYKPNNPNDIASIEIDFEDSDLYSAFELWLEENSLFLDYAKINLSKRNKLKMSK